MILKTQNLLSGTKLFLMSNTENITAWFGNLIGVILLRFYLFIYLEWVGGEAGGERESQADSALSMEPDTGPHPTTLRSWPEPKLSQTLNWMSNPDAPGIFWF